MHQATDAERFKVAFDALPLLRTRLMFHAVESDGRKRERREMAVNAMRSGAVDGSLARPRSCGSLGACERAVLTVDAAVCRERLVERRTRLD